METNKYIYITEPIRTFNTEFSVVDRVSEFTAPASLIIKVSGKSKNMR